MGLHTITLKRCHPDHSSLHSNSVLKILLEKHTVPDSWCEAKIKLVFKRGEDCSPANFHPIALTPAVGKLYHKIFAHQHNGHQWHNGAHFFPYHFFSVSACYDLPRPGKCLWDHLPWVNSNSVTLQTSTGDYCLNYRPICKADSSTLPKLPPLRMMDPPASSTTKGTSQKWSNQRS